MTIITRSSIALAALLLSLGHAAAERPNFILLYADDLGWVGTSVRMDDRQDGSKSDYYQTPNLEKMANRGLTHSNAYAASPVCSASRASIQTGMSTAAHGLTALVGWKGNGRESSPLTGVRNKTNDIRPFLTLAERLKQIDDRYATAHFGKWHLESGGPAANGFDESHGSTANEEGDIGGEDPKRTFSISQDGIAFMTESVRQHRPFFLQLSYYAVHLKMQALQTTLAKYDKLPRGRKHTNPLYAAMTEDLDNGLGMVLKAVEELGVGDNTYIVFTSDNGPYVNSDNARIKGEISSAKPLRGGKFWLYEGGIRVPMIVTGPGVRGGQIAHRTVTQYDLYPTFCDLAGGTWPDEIEGGSLRDQWLDGSDLPVDRPTESLVWHYPHFNRQATPHTAIISGDYKLVKFWEDHTTYLFNVKNDPTEQDNLRSSNTAKVEVLEDKMNQYLAQRQVLMPRAKEVNGDSAEVADHEAANRAR